MIPDALWRSCDAILVWHRMRITASVIALLEKCRLIVRVGVGYDNVDVEAARRRGIPVSNVPNYGTSEVADHALAMLLYLVRGLGLVPGAAEGRSRRGICRGRRAGGAAVARVGVRRDRHGADRDGDCAPGGGVRYESDLFRSLSAGGARARVGIGAREHTGCAAGALGRGQPARAALGTDAQHDRGAAACAHAAGWHPAEHGAGRARRDRRGLRGAEDRAISPLVGWTCCRPSRRCQRRRCSRPGSAASHGWRDG